MTIADVEPRTLGQALKTWHELETETYEAVADQLDREGVRISASEVRRIDFLTRAEFASRIRDQRHGR